MRSRATGVAVSAALMLILAAGCSTWVDIKPTELPKLSGSQAGVATVVTPTGARPMGIVTSTAVERPDGTLVDVRGRFDAEITTRAGSTLFVQPVSSTIENNLLQVRAGNRALTQFPLQDVTGVRVSQPDVARSMLAIVLLSAVGGLLIFAAVDSSVMK